jgi:hypothetical protein
LWIDAVNFWIELHPYSEIPQGVFLLSFSFFEELLTLGWGMLFSAAYMFVNRVLSGKMIMNLRSFKDF